MDGSQAGYRGHLRLNIISGTRLLTHTVDRTVTGNGGPQKVKSLTDFVKALVWLPKLRRRAVSFSPSWRSQLTKIAALLKEVVMSRQTQCVVVGVDLAGSPRRPTGICVLKGMHAKTRIACTDEEILESIHQARPDLVPIDAPLSLPPGRRTIHERTGEHFRECDRE